MALNLYLRILNCYFISSCLNVGSYSALLGDSAKILRLHIRNIKVGAVCPTAPFKT